MQDLASRPWTLEEAFGYCAGIAQKHYENFPVGSFLIPKEIRRHIHAIYAFARTADDFADEPETPDNLRMAFLENWESQLMQSVWRSPQHPIFIALKETIRQKDLPLDLFRDLLTAFKLDVIQNRHASFDDVLNYCRHSANPIGRLVLFLFGYRDPALHLLSDSICTGLQLTNFWQDLMVDLEKGRIYIPTEDFKRFDYSEEDLRNRTYNDAFQNLMAFQINRTRVLFREGHALCRQVGRNLRFELNLVWKGGNFILDSLESQQYDIFSKRPVLNKSSWIWLGAKTFLLSRF